MLGLIWFQQDTHIRRDISSSYFQENLGISSTFLCKYLTGQGDFH